MSWRPRRDGFAELIANKRREKHRTHGLHLVRDVEFHEFLLIVPDRCHFCAGWDHWKSRGQLVRGTNLRVRRWSHVDTDLPLMFSEPVFNSSSVSHDDRIRGNGDRIASDLYDGNNSTRHQVIFLLIRCLYLKNNVKVSDFVLAPNQLNRSRVIFHLNWSIETKWQIISTEDEIYRWNNYLRNHL